MNKTMDRFGSEPVTEKRSQGCQNLMFKVGSSCMQGWRVTMEDCRTFTLNLPDDPEAAFFAVYDGRKSDAFSKHAAKKLHKFIVRRPEYWNGDIEMAIKQAFVQFDNTMKLYDKLKYEDAGSTAVVVVIKNNKIYCGSAGDSRAVACVNGWACHLSFDHVLDDPSEAKRVVDAGSFIRNHRIAGVVAPSRGFGNFRFKQNTLKSVLDQAIISLPEVEQRTLTEDWEFVILASDGIFDARSNEEVTSFIRYRLGARKEPEKICEELMTSCLAAECDMVGDGVGCDNMTVILVCFLHGKTWEAYCAKMSEMVTIKMELENEDFENPITNEMKTPAQKPPPSQKSSYVPASSNVATDTEVDVSAAKRPRSGKAEDLRVESDTTEEPTMEHESVYSTSPGKLASRVPLGNTQVNDNDYQAEMRMSMQQSVRKVFTAKRSRSVTAQGKVENLQVVVNAEVEDEPTNEQANATKLPETHAKRTRRVKGHGKVEDLHGKESANEQESFSTSSKNPVKTVKRTRKKNTKESENDPIRNQEIALAPQEKSTKRPRKGKAQLIVTRTKRTRRGKGQESYTELEEESKNEHEQQSVSVPPKKPVKCTRREQVKDVIEEETGEDSTRRQVIASVPQEKSTKCPRRGKAQGKVEVLQVETNTEIKNESTNEQGNDYVSAPLATHPKRTRRAEVQGRVVDLRVKNNTEVKEKSVNEQESVSVSTKKPVKRTGRGKAEAKIEDLQVNKNTEIAETSTHEHRNLPATSEKPFKRGRRGKAKDLQLEENDEVSTMEQESALAPQEKSTKRLPRMEIKPQVNFEDLQVGDDTEVENERTIEQRSFSEPPKKPIKRTKRGQAKDLQVKENEETSTRGEGSAFVLQGGPAKRTRKGQTKDKDFPSVDHVVAEQPKRITRSQGRAHIQ